MSPYFHVAVEHGEDRTARAAEEGFGEDGGCTHFGVMCTRNGYGGARGFGAVLITGPQRRGAGHPPVEVPASPSFAKCREGWGTPSCGDGQVFKGRVRHPPNPGETVKRADRV
jgi:hypothetical protein